MPNPSVPLSQDAENELIEIWISHPEHRPAILEALDRANRYLAYDHLRDRFGEVHTDPEGNRIGTGFEPPLVIEYQVDPIEILPMRWMQQRSSG